MIIYGVALLTIGTAVYLMEVALGQYTSKPAISVYKIVPAAIGLGYSTILYAIFFISYYNQMVSNAIYYLFVSFNDPLPWTKCQESENNFDTVVCTELTESCNDFTCEYPSLYFWNNNVARIYREDDENFGSFGPVTWSLMLSSIIAWIIIYIRICQRPSEPSRLSYLMDLVPYFLLISLLYTSLSKEGASEGMRQLFVVNSSHFYDLRTWSLAFEQGFYSLGTGMTSVITLGSHAIFSSPTYIDCAIISFVLFLISFLCSIIVFGNIGILSLKTGILFNETAPKSAGLLFVVYPEALNHLSGTTFFSIVFFIMIIYIGSSVVSTMAHSILANIFELFPKTKKHPIFCGGFLVFLCFSIGAPTMVRGGEIYFEVFDRFAGGYPLLFICAIEILVVCYLYGLGRFCEDVAFMMDEYPGRYYRYLWGGGGFVILALGFANLSTIYAHHTFDWPFTLGLTLETGILAPLFVSAASILLKFQNKNQFLRFFRSNPEYGPKDKELWAKRREFTTKRKIL